VRGEHPRWAVRLQDSFFVKGYDKDPSDFARDYDWVVRGLKLVSWSEETLLGRTIELRVGIQTRVTVAPIAIIEHQRRDQTMWPTSILVPARQIFTAIMRTHEPDLQLHMFWERA
jgi:hypothetical protein